MPASVLSALIQAAHPSWGLMTAVVIAVVLWCVVHYADRLGLGIERLMLAWNRRAACKKALAATSKEDREHALAVLTELNVQSSALPEAPKQRERRSAARRSNSDRGKKLGHRADDE
jgi:hypothetical protein